MTRRLSPWTLHSWGGGIKCVGHRMSLQLFWLFWLIPSFRMEHLTKFTFPVWMLRSHPEPKLKPRASVVLAPSHEVLHTDGCLSRPQLGRDPRRDACSWFPQKQPRGQTWSAEVSCGQWEAGDGTHMGRWMGPPFFLHSMVLAQQEMPLPLRRGPHPNPWSHVNMSHVKTDFAGMSQWRL